MEGAFPVKWHRRPGYVSSRLAAERSDARLARPDSGRLPEKASDGSTHWSYRKLAAHLGGSRLLATHLNVHFHFTPTYSSWLNQVEIWFSEVERDLITRGIFTSVKDLARNLRRYINAGNAEQIQ
jgi:transposase